MTAWWNLYVAGYTFVYGIATGLLPHLFLPLLGFPDPRGPWVRLAGVMFFSLCLINVVTFREKGTRRDSHMMRFPTHIAAAQRCSTVSQRPSRSGSLRRRTRAASRRGPP